MFGLGGQGGCERRIEVFVKIQKKLGGGVGGVGSGVGLEGQGGCERRIEVFGKIPKKKNRVGKEGGQVGGSGWWGVRVDVNAMFGVGVDVGYGGCEPIIEGIVHCTKRYCTILRKLKNVGGNIEPKTLSMYLKKKKKIEKR